MLLVVPHLEHSKIRKYIDRKGYLQIQTTLHYNYFVLFYGKILLKCSVQIPCWCSSRFKALKSKSSKDSLAISGQLCDVNKISVYIFYNFGDYTLVAHHINLQRCNTTELKETETCFVLHYVAQIMILKMCKMHMEHVLTGISMLTSIQICPVMGRKGIIQSLNDETNLKVLSNQESIFTVWQYKLFTTPYRTQCL